jgi:uncharacterized protein (TIRG00374 family)
MTNPAAWRWKPGLRWLLWLAGLLLLVSLLRFVPLPELWIALRRLDGTSLILLALANGVVLLTLTGRWWVILRAWGYIIPFFSLIGYRLAAFGVSYFTPGPQFGGEPLQVHLTRRHHAVPGDRAVAAVTLDKLLELLVNFSFLMVGVWLIGRQQLLPATLNQLLMFAAAGLLALPLAGLAALAFGGHPLSAFLRLVEPLAVPGSRDLAGSQWLRRYRDFTLAARRSEAQVRRFYAHHRGALLLALLISVISWLAMIGEYWLMLALLGANLDIYQAIVVLTVARLAILLPLPGGLGVLEAGQVLALGLLGVEPAVGLSVALLVRARDVLLGGLGLWWGGVKS